MWRFIATHNATARSLVKVGFMEGLSAAEKAARGQAIADGLNLRPAEEKAATAAKLSTALKGKKRTKPKKRSREEWAETARKQAATRRANGTTNGPQKGTKYKRRANGTTPGPNKGWKVSERAL